MSAVTAQQAPSHSKPQRRSVGSRILHSLWRLFKLLFVILLGIVLGVAIWFGGLTAYNAIVIPIRSNTQSIAALQQEFQAEREAMTEALAQRDARIAELEATLADEQARSNRLSRQLDTMSSELETLRGDVLAVQSDLESTQAELDALQLDVTETQTDLSTATAEIEEVRTDLATVQQDVGALSAELETVNATLETHARELNAMSSDIADLQLAVLSPVGTVRRLQQKATLLRTQAHLLNAQFELNRQNVGLATEHLEQARAGVASIAQQVPEPEREQYGTALARIDEALQQLKADPFVADAELVAAWRALDSLLQAER